MTVNELIEALQEFVDMDEEYGELEVRLATQPNWPIRGSVAATTVATHDGQRYLWLAEGGVGYDENPYAPRTAWEGGVEGYDFDPDL
jgi:hypothetical protein